MVASSMRTRRSVANMDRSSSEGRGRPRAALAAKEPDEALHSVRDHGRPRLAPKLERVGHHHFDPVAFPWPSISAPPRFVDPPERPAPLTTARPRASSRGTPKPFRAVCLVFTRCTGGSCTGYGQAMGVHQARARSSSTIAPPMNNARSLGILRRDF